MDMEEKKLETNTEQNLPVQELPSDIPAEVRQKLAEDLNEEELNAIGRFACAAAGLSVQRPGGISSVPGKEEILALLAAGD